jgi:hypothetical protein
MTTIDGPDVDEDDALTYAVMKPDRYLIINKTGYEYLQGLHEKLSKLLLAH